MLARLLNQNCGSRQYSRYNIEGGALGKTKGTHPSLRRLSWKAHFVTYNQGWASLWRFQNAPYDHLRMANTILSSEVDRSQPSEAGSELSLEGNFVFG